MGGRNIPLFLTLGTTIATLVGTGSSMGAVGKGYSAGWLGSLYVIGGALGIVLLALIFGSVRRHNFTTMSDEFTFYTQNSNTVKKVVSLFIVLSSAGWLGVHILGGSKYLQFITNIPPIQAKIIITASFGLYVIVGGYKAVVWIDSLQALVLFAGFITVSILSVIKLNGFSNLQTTHVEIIKANGHPEVLPAISLILVSAVGVLATPSFRQRIYTGRSTKTVRSSFYISGILFLIFALFPAIIGICAFSDNPDLKEADLAFPYMITQSLSVWAAVVILIAGLSATMSSASSDAITGVSSIINDFKKNEEKSASVTHSRISLLIILSVALMFSLLMDNILDYIQTFISILMGGMCSAGILGRLWKPFNATGLISCLLAGSIASIFVLIHPPTKQFLGNPIIPSLILSLVAGIVTSLLTQPKLQNSN